MAIENESNRSVAPRQGVCNHNVRSAHLALKIVARKESMKSVHIPIKFVGTVLDYMVKSSLGV